MSSPSEQTGPASRRQARRRAAALGWSSYGKRRKSALGSHACDLDIGPTRLVQSRSAFNVTTLALHPEEVALDRKNQRLLPWILNSLIGQRNDTPMRRFLRHTMLQE
jgi:hypothetical protein